MAAANPRTRGSEGGDAVTYTIEMARKLLDDAGCAFLQTERGKCLKSMVEQLAEANAHATRLQDRLAEVQAEKSDALIAAVKRLSREDGQ